MSDDHFWLTEKSSKARLRAAENARKNRQEIIKAHSQKQITRRDLIKWGLITTGGLLLPINGLSPFAQAQVADTNSVPIGQDPDTGGVIAARQGRPNIPTGLPPSPLFGVQAFTQPMPRFDVLPRNAVGTLSPAPTAQANTTLQPVAPELGGGFGPIEGRPPGPI